MLAIIGFKNRSNATMKKLLLLFGIYILYISTATAQTAVVKGVITDTTSKQNLLNTSVVLLNAKDSMMVSFTRSNAKGFFEIKNLKAGKYLLLSSYPSYADYVDAINLTDTSIVDLGRIAMILKANILKEVIVKQQIGAIKLKGDTTEYTADSFKVQANATVEDLLKKLPGIQIDKNGNITAQGEKVQKVLVDGEEFFGDDPTLVTQNLRADMIEKVQVFDKKSDQADFTGIDDGEKNKTINLKLKDNKKNGYFGKINAGGGTDGYHDNQAMVNIFKNKQKFAVYGIVSNTGKTGLNWQDRDNYGESFLSNADYDENNGYFSINSSSDFLDSWDGQFRGQGFPLVQTGGIHYNNKWNDDRQNINGNYKILQLHMNGGSATNSQYILPDTLYYNNYKEDFAKQILRNRLNGSYEFKIDSSSSLKITADGGIDHSISKTVSTSQALDINLLPVNSSDRTLSSEGDTRTVNSNLLWRKKFKKKGRTISFNLRQSFSNNDATGYLYSENQFYSKGVIAQKQITDQYKTTKTVNQGYDTKITYSEPLSASSSLVLNYGIVVNNSNSTRNSFNKDGGGKYSELDSIYSNDYRFNILTHKGGFAYTLVKKKLRFSAGNNVGITSFNQTENFTKSEVKRNFINWYPSTSLSYKFSSQKRLSFNYYGNTQQPSINDLQPVASNDDPLNIYIGNPNLKPAFENEFSFNFSDYKVLTDRNLWTSFSYNFTGNAISSRDNIDTSGKRIYQSINVTGNRSYNGYIDYGFKLKKLDLRLGFNGNFNAQRNVSIVNDVNNITNSVSYTAGMYLSKDVDKKYSISISPNATYTSSTSSVQKSIQTNYWTFSLSPNVDVYLPLKFQIHSDADINFRQKTSVFDNNTNVILWNAWVGKKFMKKDALLLKATVNDLLNQNLGFSRTVSNNYITQNTYATIQRYFMLSVVWNFTKAGTASPGGDDE